MRVVVVAGAVGIAISPAAVTAADHERRHPRRCVACLPWAILFAPVSKLFSLGLCCAGRFGDSGYLPRAAGAVCLLLNSLKDAGPHVASCVLRVRRRHERIGSHDAAPANGVWRRNGRWSGRWRWGWRWCQRRIAVRTRDFFRCSPRRAQPCDSYALQAAVRAARSAPRSGVPTRSASSPFLLSTPLLFHQSELTSCSCRLLLLRRRQAPGNRPAAQGQQRGQRRALRAGSHSVPEPAAGRCKLPFWAGSVPFCSMFVACVCPRPGVRSASYHAVSAVCVCGCSRIELGCVSKALRRRLDPLIGCLNYR